MTHKVYDYIGGKIWLDVDESDMMRLRSESRYETAKIEAMAEFLRPGMSFVDVGACRGYFSLYAAKLVGPRGYVRAIEPEPVNVAWLRRNVHMNGYSNITIHECAAGASNEVGTGWLSLSEMSGQHSMLSVDSVEHSYPVHVHTLDYLVRSAVHAVKIDVEGYEMDVIAGGSDVLTSMPEMLLMIDLHPSLYASTEKVKLVIGFMGYKVIAEDAFSIIARRSHA